MTPVKGEHTADCFRACVASLLNLPLSGVPSFMGGLTPGDAMPLRQEREMLAWFTHRGLYLIGLPLPAPSFEVLLQAVAFHHPGLHCIVTGRSPRGTDHAVIARDGAVAHDPARVALGLSGPHADGFYQTYFVGLLV